jgi:cytochrome c peroxidase
MNNQRTYLAAVLATAGVAVVISAGAIADKPSSPALTPIEQLGKSIFLDTQLSLRKNQSCADCHDPKVGGTGPIPGINKKGAAYPGSVKTRFGNRKPPTSGYATPAPVLHYVVEDGQALFIGGNFWDGRATGEKLGNPAADQAQGPFLNPMEQALPDPACVVYRVCNPQNRNKYPVGFEQVWGAGTCNIVWPGQVDQTCSAGRMVNLASSERNKVNAAYDQIGRAVAAFEASAEVNSYSSKFDAHLAGKAALTPQEQHGLELFQGKGLCAACHVLEPQEDGNPPLFTDFTFDNLGVPKNPDNPGYDRYPDFIDLGLGGFLANTSNYAAFAKANEGKHKVPTLRNVDLRPGKGFTKAYMHNGYFKTLEGVVNFYNTRDVKPACPDPMTREADALAQGCWPAPEVAENVNTDELGNLGLTPEQEAAIVAFMKTLSDGYEGH